MYSLGTVELALSALVDGVANVPTMSTVWPCTQRPCTQRHFERIWHSILCFRRPFYEHRTVEIERCTILALIGQTSKGFLWIKREARVKRGVNSAFVHVNNQVFH